MVIAGHTTDYDVAVIGAGAAGVAAAKTLLSLGLSVVIIEGRNRVGGRAYTSMNGTVPLDLGCEWLHSADRNAVVPVAKAMGLSIDRSRPGWGAHVGPGFSLQQRDTFNDASNRFWAALETAARDGEPDRPASDFLEAGNRWNGLIGAISTYYNGVEPEGVSVVDLDRYIDTGVNWRIREGYGTFVERAAAGVDIRLGCPVLSIDHSGVSVGIATAAGTLTAAAVVVTVPTDVLAHGAIIFDPPLPDHLHAAASLPLGLADKVFFEIAAGSNIPEGHFWGATDRTETFSFEVSRHRNVVQGFVGGRFARELERGGPSAFDSEARAQVSHMLGADAARQLRFLCATEWATDPFSLGAYSHARPGCADQRAVLATAVEGRLFFAGEACSRSFFSTAHGAWETGVAAAAAIVATLPRASARPQAHGR